MFWKRSPSRRPKNSVRKRACARSRTIAKCMRPRKRIPKSLLGRTGQAAALVRSSEKSAGLETAAREMVCRRQAERRPQLPGPPSGKEREQARAHVGGRRRLDHPVYLSPSCTSASANLPTCWARWACKPGDCIAIYMPMVPELPIAMLGCARVGAVHSVIFGGFSATAISDRVADCKAKLLHHRRRRLPPRKNRPLERNSRRRHEELPHDRKMHRGAAHQGKRRMERRPRPVVARAGRKSLQGTYRHAIRFRASALHPLYQRHHRKTERRAAHLGRLPAPMHVEHSPGFRFATRTTSTGAPPTSAGSPATATWFTARFPTAPAS